MPEGSLCRVVCRGQALHRTRFEFLVSCEDVSSIRRKGSALERDEPEYHRYFVYAITYMVLVSKSFKNGDFNVQ